MKKRCKRKVYALTDPIGLAIAGAAITPDAKLNQLRMLELSQIDALARGAATLNDLRTLTDMINVCQTMADTGVGPEALPACAAAETALLAIMRRFERWGKLEALACEIEALREVFRYHDLQRQSISRAEYERAIKKTGDRIRSAHPSVKVIA